MRPLFVCIILLVCASCVAPAYNDSQFEAKAAKTAKDAASAIETARLALDEDLRHGLPVQPIDTAISDQEEAIGAVAGTFSSVQPLQTATSDKLRAEVGDLLEAAQTHLKDARIALRRGDVRGAVDAIHAAAPEADRLEAIADR